MATEAIVSVTEIGKLLVEPVRRQVNYFRNYEKHVKTLTKEMVKMKEEMVKLDHAVKEADREGKRFVGDVDGLVNEANELIKNAEAFLRNNENEDSGNNKCKVIFCSVWIKQYQHGRKANKMSKKVADLVNRKTAKFGDGSMTYSGPDRGAIEPLKGFEEFQSRKQILKDMMAALRSPGVTKIGAYGMNGVGKTTLVRAIASQACKEQLVDEVAMATVFQAQNINKEGEEEAVTPDIKRIQDEITDCFKFKLQNTTVSRKADELQKRLKDEKKIKRLIILDDVWVGVKLEDIGIPDDHDGCKILMTSTDEHVLSREMGSKNFQLNPLQLPEAHEWFKKMVGDVVKDPEIGRVADNIVEKCDCLPILLVHVTNGLKYVENLNAWDSALDQLSNYDKDGSHRLVDVGLRLSINQLQEDAKQLFLLCGQFAPDGISINYLLRYSIAMGLFGNKCHTLAVSRMRLMGLVSQLKACSLLQEGRDREILMMHNIVHSFVMSFQAKNALMISENDLPPWPGVDLEICTAISLYCKISDLPEELKCPNLNFFLLSNDNSPLQFPKHFFRAMGKLKVLNFTGLDFSSSLPSFEFLTNLQTLCLDECKLNGVTNMGIISQLKNLKILSFRGSNIVRLPIEIKQLSHLQLLDLNECLKLKEIPQTLLSDLKRLEDLYMEYVCLNWEVEGTKNRLTELAPLTNLSSLCIHIADPMILTMDLFSEKLERFKILIGGHWDWFDRHDSSKTLKLKLNGNVLSMKRIRVLMKKVEELYLQELDAGKTSVREIDGFPRLKHLHMKMVHKIEYINSLERDSISFDKMTLSKGSSAAFTMLESLYLENLKDLKKISHGKFIAKSFGNLRILEVTNCPALKYLFSTSMANALPLLEEFEISDCETLEAMAIEESEDDTGRVQNINLPQLQKLKLESLPNFASFWSKKKKIELQNVGESPNTEPLFGEKLSCPNLKELHLSSVNMENIWQERVPTKSSWSIQNLTSVIVDGCNNLKCLLSFSMVKTAVNLKSLWICNCLMMKKVIVMEGFQDQMVFQHLEELYLQNLPELAGFCSCNLLKFPSLSSLEIDNCPQLRRFILNSNGENDVVDTEADMTEYILFDEKVAFPNLSDLLIYNMAKLKKIWHTDLHESSFCKLNRLIISDADELLKIFPSSYAQTRLQNLECIEVVDCKSLEEVFDTQTLINKNESDAMTTQLKKMHLIGLPNLRHIWAKEILDILSFQNIRIVIASGCPNLKSLFPVSLAKELRELQRLFVYDGGMVEIISKDKEEEVEERFQFPQLTNLYLHKLPELKKFYSGRHTVECPVLKVLHVNCENVEIFMSEQGYLELQSKPNLNRQPTVGVMITEESTTSSVSAGEASDFVQIGKNLPRSDPVGQALEISTEEESATLIVSGEQVPNNFQSTEHSDYGPCFKHETNIKFTIDEQESSTQFEVGKLAFPTQASRDTSSLKEDATQSGLVLHKETRISLQIQKRPQESNQNERQPDDVSDSFNQQTSTIPEFPTAAEFFALSTVAYSTMSTSYKESNYMASMPNSETPFQLAGSSFHAPADLESLLASTEDLQKQHQEFSYKPSSSSVTVTDFHNSSASSENYVYSMVSLKKILKKSLTEVARSTDAHHLLINLVNLKNSPILNSDQAEVIQDYIDNFDSLVANQPFCEQQIDMGTSALVYSIEQKQRSIANLEALCQSSNIMSNVRAIAEYVYADLVAKKRELETDISVLSKAKSLQQEAAEKGRKASDSWEKLRNLFT